MKIMNTCGADLIINTLLAATNFRSPSATWHQNKYETLDDILNVRTPQFKQFLIDFADKYKTDNGAVLDVACGSGLDSAILLDRSIRVVGTDMAEDMVRLSKDNKEFLIQHGGERSDNEVKATLQGFFDCLRPGGALMFDSRNFIPVHDRGVINGKGLNPKMKDQKNHGVKDVLPHLVYGPGPEKVAIAVVLQYINLDGSSTFITLNPLVQDTVKQHVRSVFGENCIIKVCYDLQDEADCKPADACWVDYIVEKPQDE